MKSSGRFFWREGDSKREVLSRRLKTLLLVGRVKVLVAVRRKRRKKESQFEILRRTK